jgi:secondary thiamine-phosphate synthase enzyme
VRTGTARGIADLTAACAAFLVDVDADDGLLSVFVPHATAGLVVMEIGAGSDDDLLDALDRLLPREDRLYRHRHGSPGHGADHVVPLLASPSLTVPVLGGRLALGTWQSICLLDPNADNALAWMARRSQRLLHVDAPRVELERAAGASMHRRGPSRPAVPRLRCPSLAGRRYTPVNPSRPEPVECSPGQGSGAAS